jgi:hypothetical protein
MRRHGGEDAEEAGKKRRHHDDAQVVPGSAACWRQPQTMLMPRSALEAILELPGLPGTLRSPFAISDIR